MIISMSEAKEAERVAKAQRIAAGRWLLVDESKIASPKDTMILHRVRAAAAEGSGVFDEMLRDRPWLRFVMGRNKFSKRPLSH